MDKNIIQEYMNNFRRNISKNLKPNIGIQIDSYNTEDGAMLIIYFVLGGKSADREFDNYKRISDALSSIDQNFVSGNLSQIHFGGTNMMMEPNRIIIIKEKADEEWSSSKLLDDLNSIMQPPSKSNSI